MGSLENEKICFLRKFGNNVRVSRRRHDVTLIAFKASNPMIYLLLIYKYATYYKTRFMNKVYKVNK